MGSECGAHVQREAVWKLMVQQLLHLAREKRMGLGFGGAAQQLKRGAFFLLGTGGFEQALQVGQGSLEILGIKQLASCTAQWGLRRGEQLIRQLP